MRGAWSRKASSHDRWTFFIAARYFKVHDKIKAGEYSIKANASLRDMLDTLVEGKSILYSVSIPEGLPATRSSKS